MNSSVETLEGNKVKVSVSIDEAEFDRSIDQAFKKIAREVRLPGFRAGKAPRRVLEARIGLQPAREQALQDAIPQYLAQAVREHDVDLIATPEVEVTSGTEEGPVAFDATCEVRPEITVPGYGGLRVELRQPDGDRRRGAGGDRRPSSSATASWSTSSARRRAATTSPSTSSPPVTASRSPGSTPRTGRTRSVRAGSPTTSTTS